MDTGWLAFTNSENDASEGVGTWANLSGALDTGMVCANGFDTEAMAIGAYINTTQGAVSGQQTGLLKLTGPVSIPVACRDGIIKGIQVQYRIRNLNASPTPISATCKLVIDGNIDGDDLSTGQSVYSVNSCAGDGYSYNCYSCLHDYGGVNSLWGASKMNGSVINRSNFGAVFSMIFSNGNTIIHYGLIKFHYEPSLFYAF